MAALHRTCYPAFPGDTADFREWSVLHATPMLPGGGHYRWWEYFIYRSVSRLLPICLTWGWSHYTPVSATHSLHSFDKWKSFWLSLSMKLLPLLRFGPYYYCLRTLAALLAAKPCRQRSGPRLAPVPELSCSVLHPQREKLSAVAKCHRS